VITPDQADKLTSIAEQLAIAAQKYGEALADCEADEYDADIAQTRLVDTWIDFGDAVEGMAT
jgi:hypothetical protein